MGHGATVFYKCLASLLSDKWKEPYATALGWLRCPFVQPYNASELGAPRPSHNIKWAYIVQSEIQFSDFYLFADDK